MQVMAPGSARTAAPVWLRIVLWLVLLTASAVDRARADWMNLTGAETAPNIAEITILDDRVHIALEVYIGDLATFNDLLPDDWLKDEIGNRPPLGERLQRFSAETLQVVTGDGAKLQAKLTLVEPRFRKDRYSPFAGMINPTTRQRVPNPPADKRVLYAEIDYPFTDKPQTLTFIPPTGKKGLATVTIGFIAYHKAVPIIDFRYLSGPATLELDWADPWYSKFDNPNLKRHHKSALMTFLYVEPREVRHEVLVRVRDLKEWTNLGLSGGATISASEQAKIKRRAREFFMTRNPMRVDGMPIKPVSSRAKFLTISVAGLQIIEEEKSLDLSTALLGIILSYPVSHLPKNVKVLWDLFDERVDQIPATAIDPAGPLPGFVDARHPVLEWQNFLLKYQAPSVTAITVDDGRSIRAPLLSAILLVLAVAATYLAIYPTFLSRRSWIASSVLCAVAGVLLLRFVVVEVPNPFLGAPDEKSARQIVAGVLNNVNYAYLEKDAAALRRALEIIVADDALDAVEAELGRALAIKVVGGGIARVNTIENLALKNVTPLDNRTGFRSLAEWTAKASAGHWGHIHRRTIRFRALVEIVQEGGAWKLFGITVVQANQKIGA
jgi:hypothetical protein